MEDAKERQQRKRKTNNLFAGAAFPLNEKEGTVDMCKAWDDMKIENFKHGLEKVAVNLIQKGFDDQFIHETTGLSLARIAENREKEMCMV